MPLTQDQQTIFDAVITALRTNSKTIDQLTPQASLADSDYFELNGGRKVSYATMKSMFAALSDADIVNLNQAITNALEQASTAMTAAQAAQTAAESADGKADAAITRTDNNSRLISQLQGNLQIVDWVLKSISAGTAAPDSVKARMRRVNAWSSEEDEREIVLLTGATEEAAGAMTAQHVKDLKLAKGLMATKGHAYGLAPLDASALVPEKHLPDKVFDVLTFSGIDDTLYDHLETGSAAATPEDANASLVYSDVRDRFVLRVRETVSGGGISTNPPKYYGWFNGAERYGTADQDGIVPYENKLYLDLYDGGVYYWYDLMLRKTDLNVSIRIDSLEDKIGKANGIAPLNASGVVPNENISDEARKSLFCDLFNAAAGTAGYAKFTNGVWDCKLNGLTLSYDEAVLIYNVTISGFTTGAFRETAIRTNLYKIGQSYGWGNGAENMPQGVFTNCPLLEVARINKSDDGVTWASSWRYMFNGCYALHTVIGVLGGDDSNREILIGNAPKLVKLRINRLARNLDIRYSPLWSLESVSYTIENAGNGTTAITITVHADVYAKLTGDTTNEAAAALTADELSQWQALLTKAAGKHIAFASA